MSRTSPLPPRVVYLSCALLFGAAQASAEYKSVYTVFNPTPREHMRDLSTDRPDKTETPYTVDAGHVQIEMDLANYTHRENKNSRTREWNIAPINLKIGLLNSVDLQVIFDNYIVRRDKTSDAQRTQKTEGVGDVTARVKVNLWGNDSGKSALALMPFVKFPTNSNDLGNNSYEGGFIVPLALTLPHEIWLGLMTELDIVRDDDNRGNHADFVNTATLGHALIGELAGYVEFFSSISSADDSPWVGTVDCGVTYALSDDIQLDGGVNFGVTNSADDYQPFIGLSVRY